MLYVLTFFLNFTFLFFLLVGACKSYFVALVLLSLRSVHDVNNKTNERVLASSSFVVFAESSARRRTCLAAGTHVLSL